MGMIHLKTSDGMIRSSVIGALIICWFATVSAEDWPEWRGTDRSGLWNAEGVVESFDGMPDPLPRVWSAPVGAGYSGPTVAGDGVYLLDRGLPSDSEPVERVVCVDRATGKQKWVHRYACEYRDVGYDFGPRSSVTVKDGKAFALGMMGHLHCLDAETGELIWAKDLSQHYKIDMPIWGLTSSPLVEDGVVILQAAAPGEGACVVGLDLANGNEIWRAFPDKASYVSPIIVEQDGKRVVVVWTGMRIAGMNAATGDVYWDIPTHPNKMPINVPGPAVSEDGKLMFLSVFYDGSRLIELSQDTVAAKELWARKGINERTTDALHNMISPPYIYGGYIYGIDSYGQMRCLDPSTGDRVWENLEAVPQGRWGTGFMVRNGKITWMLTERGELVMAKLTPEGYSEIDRVQIIDATTPLKQREEGTVLWSHPAFAGTQIFARNDRELICVELKQP